MASRIYAHPGRPARHLRAQRELAVNLSWKTVLEYLQDPKADVKHKVEIAKSICVKNIPTVLEGDGLGVTRLIIVKADGNTTKTIPE